MKTQSFLSGGAVADNVDAHRIGERAPTLAPATHVVEARPGRKSVVVDLDARAVVFPGHPEIGHVFETSDEAVAFGERMASKLGRRISLLGGPGPYGRQPWRREIDALVEVAQPYPTKTLRFAKDADERSRTSKSSCDCDASAAPPGSTSTAPQKKSRKNTPPGGTAPQPPPSSPSRANAPSTTDSSGRPSDAAPPECDIAPSAPATSGTPIGGDAIRNFCREALDALRAGDAGPAPAGDFDPAGLDPAPIAPQTNRPGKVLRPVAERFAFFVMRHANGCHVWTGNPCQKHPTLWVGARRIGIQRLALEIAGQPVADDLYVVPTCRNLRCVNVEHLRTSTMSGLLDRVVERRRPSAREPRTTCLRGHAFTPENTYVTTQGKRTCRECIRLNLIRARGEMARVVLRGAPEGIRDAARGAKGRPAAWFGRMAEANPVLAAGVRDFLPPEARRAVDAVLERIGRDADRSGDGAARELALVATGAVTPEEIDPRLAFAGGSL